MVNLASSRSVALRRPQNAIRLVFNQRKFDGGKVHFPFSETPQLISHWARGFVSTVFLVPLMFSCSSYLRPSCLRKWLNATTTFFTARFRYPMALTRMVGDVCSHRFFHNFYIGVFTVWVRTLTFRRTPSGRVLGFRVCEGLRSSRVCLTECFDCHETSPGQGIGSLWRP